MNIRAMKTILYIAVLAGIGVSFMHAQDITGGWQGTLSAGAQQLRIVLHIAKGDEGR